MLIIAGHLVVADRDAYVELSAPVTALARSAPGCLDFVQAADPLEPDRIVIYERWEDEASLLAFRSSDPDAAPLPDILGADVKRYEISSVGQP